MSFAMDPNEFMNQALPWIFGAFVVVWILIFLIKMLIDAWKDN